MLRNTPNWASQSEKQSRNFKPMKWGTYSFCGATSEVAYGSKADIAAALAMPLLLAAAGASGKTLVFCSEGSPENFYPGVNTTGTSFDANSQIYSRIVDFERGGTTVVPGLAERWTISPDAKVYTFYLRKGVKLHNHRAFKPTRDFNAEGKTAGFDPANPPWVQLGPKAFDRPANACATLAHEQVHAEHHTIARELFAKFTDYQHKHPHSKESFRDWAGKQVKTAQDVRTAEIVAGLYDGAHAATELEAHIEAAKVAFASGDLVQARTDLTKVATLPNLPAQRQTSDLSIEVLKNLRNSLSGDALKVFDEVAAKAPSRSVLRDKSLH
jgi:hypothetical protein